MSDSVFGENPPVDQWLSGADGLVVDFASMLEGGPLLGPAITEWYQGQVREIQARGRVAVVRWPIHGFTPKEWRGSPNMETVGVRLSRVRRQKRHIGAYAVLEDLAEYDIASFDRTPESIDIAFSKMEGSEYATRLNWGHKITDFTGTYFFETAANKPVNPLKTEFGTWLNAFENTELDGPNLTDVILPNIQARKGYDGKSLGWQGTRLLVPTAKYELAKNLVQVVQLTSGVGPDGSTNVGGVTSTTFGRLEVVVVPDLRSDMCIVQQFLGAGMDMFKPFVRVLPAGGEGPSAPTVNADPKNFGGGLPHWEIITFDTSDDLYKTQGKIGVDKICREGWGLGAPHTMTAFYDGLKTATADGVNYNGTLPKSLRPPSATR